MAKFNSYIICATPRSGSTLLCKLLLSSGIAGKPESYFHQPSVSAWQKSLDITPDETSDHQHTLRQILVATKQAGKNGTNIFGLRLMRKSFAYLLEQLDILYPDLPETGARLKAAFGKTAYIHLARNDKVAQAVSLVTAAQSGLWHKAPDGTELERSNPPQALNYAPDNIAKELAEVTRYDQNWHNWFKQEQITPLHLTYESLAAAPTEKLAEILDYLGLDKSAANGITPAVTRLADQTSREWVKRFRSEHANQLPRE